MVGPCGLACPDPAKGTADLYRVKSQPTCAYNRLGYVGQRVNTANYM